MKEHLNPTLAEVGERAAINVIIAHAPSSRNGDDAAVLGHASANSRAVVTTDMLVQDRHFRLDWSTPAEIGRKAITQNFADIEAMGARPVAALLAISAPAYTRLNFVSELARGISSRVKDYSAELVGGDITDGEAIVIAVTAVGQLGGSLPELSLDRARPGHTIIASGGIGESAAGYALLQRFGRTDIPEKFLPLVTAHCATIVPEGRGFVARSAGVSSLTDNSDGLIVDLRTMAKKIRRIHGPRPRSHRPNTIDAGSRRASRRRPLAMGPWRGRRPHTHGYHCRRTSHRIPSHRNRRKTTLPRRPRPWTSTRRRKITRL
ncbi:Thiamine monophosphate kinase [Corynebacterium ulcerans BR-AD22]|nr:Thiamine monophosphate kinase [Corynebacterium ulcerans BR-AD22]